MLVLKGTSSASTGEESERNGAWLLMYEVSDAWSDEVARLLSLKQQSAYFQTLRLAGLLRYGGLLDDGTSALAIVQGVTQTKAVELLACDPTIVSRVFAGKVRPFMIDVE